MFTNVRKYWGSEQTALHTPISHSLPLLHIFTISAHTDTHRDARARTHAHTRVHTHTQTHTYTYTHKHTQARAQIYVHEYIQVEGALQLIASLMKPSGLSPPGASGVYYNCMFIHICMYVHKYI